jgi:hypothetical protein
MCDVDNSRKFPLYENIWLKIKCNCPIKWSSSEKRFWMFTLYINSKNTSYVKLYQVLLILFSHFLYCASRMTSLKFWSGIILMDWMWKKSWTSDGFTWPISMDLQRKIMLNINKIMFDICGKKNTHWPWKLTFLCWS